jgi:hypothetical protein
MEDVQKDPPAPEKKELIDQSYDISEMMQKENLYSEILTDEDEAEEVAEPLKDVDFSKLEKEGVRQMGRDVVICRDLSSI